MAAMLVHPSAIELTEVQPGALRSQRVIIKNTDTRVHGVRIRGPKSRFFSISGSPNGQQLAPGTEVTFQVHFHGEELESVKEVAADLILIQSDAGDVKLPIKIIMPHPDVRIEGDLMYGLIPAETAVTRTFQLVNRGSVADTFRIEWDKATGLVLEPASGRVPGVDPNGPPGLNVVDITAKLTPPEVGNIIGEFAIFLGQEPTEGRKMAFSATVVKQTYEVLDAHSTRVTELDFGTRHFSDSASRSFVIFNNGPVPTKYMLRYGGASEMAAKAEDDGSAAQDTDPEDPYADLIASARQKLLAKETHHNPFLVSPLAATIPPYGKVTVNIDFRPKDVPLTKGFQAKLGATDSYTRIFDFMALIDFVGCPPSTRIKLPMRGKGVSPGLKIDQLALAFGDVLCNGWADQPVHLTNSGPLPLQFSAPPAALPYFKLQPHAGTILPGQTKQVHVRYTPKALGSHKGSLVIQVTGEGCSSVLQELTVQVSGSSLRMGEKPPLVGGPDKVATDFIKPPNYMSEDQMIASMHKAHELSSKGPTPFWERPDVQRAFNDISENGTAYALGKQQFVTVKQHLAKYTKEMRKAQTERQRKAHNKHVEESDVNAGLNTRSGLRDPQPRLPRVVEPLWTATGTQDAHPKLQRTVTAVDLASVPLHRDRPVGEAEQAACSRELTREDIMRLIMGPKVVDFGTLSVGSSGTSHLMMTNTLDAPIHVIMDLRQVPELRGSTHTSQVIPAGSRAKFPLTLSCSEIKAIHDKVDVCINGNHVLPCTVAGQVVPVTVDLSSEDVQFEFTLDDWERHLDRIVQVSNHHKFPVEFSLTCSSPEAFTVTPAEGVIKPQSSVELLIRWVLPPELFEPLPPPKKGADGAQPDGKAGRAATPSADTPLPGHSVVLEAMLVLNLMGGDQPRRIALHGQLPDSRLRPKDRMLDAGAVPLSSPLTMTAQIRNCGSRVAAFRVVPNPLLQVKPDKMRVAPDEVVDLSVAFAVPNPGPLLTAVELQVQGGRNIRIPVKAEGVVPVVTIDQDLLDVGSVYLGSFSRLPFTLTNTTAVPAELMLDLRLIPDLQVTIARDAWSSADYDECPLQKIGALGENQPNGSRRGSVSSDRGTGSRRCSSLGAMGFTGITGYMFKIQLNPSKALDLQLVYKAQSAGTFTWPLVFSSTMGGAPLAVTAKAQGVKPRLTINKTSVDFGTQTVIRANQIKPPYSDGLCLSNREGELPVEVQLGPLRGADAGVFFLDTFTHVIGVGEMLQAMVQFCPRDGRTYEASLPVYLDGDTSEPYFDIEVVGAGQHPRLTFDVRECILPPVPLGVMSCATFNIINGNYDNLELTCRLPADESHLPLRLEFPEGNLIGLARERLPVVVRFESARPVSFTANIDFMDEDGKRYSIPVSACTDASLLTLDAFLAANMGKLEIESADLTAPVRLKTGADAPPYVLPLPSASIGPTQPILGVVRYLNAASGRGPYDMALHTQLAASRGKLLKELLEMLSGKQLQTQPGKPSSNRKEAAMQLVSLYDAALTFLRAHGALLNAVKPEMLLEEADLQRVLAVRASRAEDDPHQLEALGLWAEVQDNFQTVSAQAWNAVIAQMMKVFVLGRVSLRSLRSLPSCHPPTAVSAPPPATSSANNNGSPPTSQPSTASSDGQGAGGTTSRRNSMWALITPPDSSIVGSNLYSVAESCLLAWLTASYARTFGTIAARITNFDEDLKDARALFSLLAEYWPNCAVRRNALHTGPALNPSDCADNAEVVIRIMADLGLQYELSARDICEPDAREMLMLVLYLYQTLPQLVPKTSIEFVGRLGESQMKELELKNPSRKAIAYTARLEGHPDFTIDSSVVRMDAAGTTRLPCKCTPTTSLPQEARLILMSKRDGGGAHAATMVFLLKETVNSRAPLKRIRTEGPLYELQQFEFTATNPFKTECDFMISLTPEPAEPPVRPPPDPKPTRRGSGRAPPQRQSPSPTTWAPPAGADLYPPAFGLDRTRLRLKSGTAEKIKAFFLPFYMGTHYCTLVFKDRDQGEFTYELVGEALLPAPSLDVKGVVPLEGPHHTFDMCIPLHNPQLDVAKRTFLDKHPLAKDRAIAAVVKADPFKGLGEAVYKVSLTSSLMSCASSVTLATGVSAPLPYHKGGPPPGRKDDPVPPGILRVALKPIGTGIYPGRLLLTSVAGLDTRVVDLELTAQTLTQKFDLLFDCATRQTIVQDIPLVNASDQYMVVHSQLSGSRAFSGPREVSVAPSSTAAFHLTFKPTFVGDHTGTLELSIPSTGEKNTYALVGRAAEPVAESHILIECRARTPASRNIPVPNIVQSGAAEYNVLCTLDFVAGAGTFRVSGVHSTNYKLTVAPMRSGTYVGSLTFKTTDGQYVWYSLEVRASEPPEVGTIRVSARAHSAVGIQVVAANPLPDRATLDVRYSHPDILVGPPTVELAPGSDGPTVLAFYYAPLVPGKGKGAITLEHPELGEFWYHIDMEAEPALPQDLPPLTAQLGASASHMIPVDNPLDRPVMLKATLTGSDAFSITPAAVALGPSGSASVELRYTPTRTWGGDDAAELVLDSPEAGTFTYRIAGRARAPEPTAPITVRHHARTSAPARTSVTWCSPFAADADVSLGLSGPGAASGHVALAQPSAPRSTVPPGGSLVIPLDCKATASPAGGPVTAELTVTAALAADADAHPVTWRYPISVFDDQDAEVQGAETPFVFNCRAKQVVEQRLEVVLRGLGPLPPQGELFRHSLVFPPGAEAAVAGALVVTPLGPARLTSPDTPLSFHVRFAPTAALETTTVGLVIAKASGGRWRFDLQLTAPPQGVAQRIVLEAAMDTTAAVAVPLYSAREDGQPQAYKAWLSPETPLSFDIQPATGLLYPEAGPHPPGGQGRLTVLYTCRDFDKQLKGSLFVQTDDMLHRIDLLGRMPSYKPPKPSDLRPVVNTRLSRDVADQLRVAADSGTAVRGSHVARNIRRIKGGSTSLH